MNSNPQFPTTVHWHTALTFSSVYIPISIPSISGTVIPVLDPVLPCSFHVGLSVNKKNNRIQRRYSRFFFTTSSQIREPSPTRTLKWPGRNRVQNTCNSSSAYHVQHVVLRAKCWGYRPGWFVLLCWLVALMTKQHASVSQGRICSDKFACCHTGIGVADPTFYLTQSQYTDAGQTSPSTDPILPGTCHGSQ